MYRIIHLAWAPPPRATTEPTALPPSASAYPRSPTFHQSISSLLTVSLLRRTRDDAEAPRGSAAATANHDRAKTCPPAWPARVWRTHSYVPGIQLTDRMKMMRCFLRTLTPATADEQRWRETLYCSG